MIKNIHIENYRSIKNLSLELDKLNIIFGPNGCGKSNLYKAIHLLSGAATNQLSSLLSDEGGIENAMWTGISRSNHSARRLLLS